METFFVTYNTGEYDSYFEHTYTIDAPSKEALIEEIKKSFERYYDLKKQKRQAMDDVIQKYRPKNLKTAGQKDWQLYNSEVDKVFSKFGIIGKMVVFGNLMPPFSDYYDDNNDKIIEDSYLSVYSIAEYIEYCRPEKPILNESELQWNVN
jgi:hypothetical protein